MISRKNTFLIIIVSCLLLVVGCWLSVGITFAETAVFKNGGFPQKGIWYSKDLFFDGDKIRIYSAIYNSSQYELLGTAEFYDNDKGIGKVDFSVSGGGRIKDVWIDWQATGGNHKISAKIISAKILKSGSTAEPIILQNNQTGVDERFIDIDTDKDGVGNIIDNDDDNDGRTDGVEIQQGTDPLKKDSPLPPTDLETKFPSGTPILSAASKTVDFVIKTAKTTTKAINKLADSQSKKIEAKKEEVKKEIEQINNDNDDNKKESPKTEKPLKYAYLTALSLAGFILDKKILLYLLLAFILYKLLKFTYKKARKRYNN